MARKVDKHRFVRAALPELLPRLAASDSDDDRALMDVFVEELYAEARRTPGPAWLEGAPIEVRRRFGLP